MSTNCLSSDRVARAGNSRIFLWGGGGGGLWALSFPVYFCLHVYRGKVGFLVVSDSDTTRYNNDPN